ncbi:3-dioxygenase (CatE) [Commensalibacter communis]|uniref:VOC family protein n=1 Tax=Commensalibacter communis TaxID=2972786 RepID=UPI0022FFBE20|nr:VOC family protein [Commensalibacter communis]CAI3956158.1 3-dioxygenase (CatE) [Commensalibacter communis]
MSIRRLNHIVICVSDIEISTRFYRDILGLELVSTLPEQNNWKEMRFFCAKGKSTNHHDLAIIANATLPSPGWGQPISPGLFHVAFEVGTIAELEEYAVILKSANSFIDQLYQPMHLSVYGKDPDGIAIEIIWRIPNDCWTYSDLWRAPLNFEEAIARWGATLKTGAAAGEST